MWSVISMMLPGRMTGFERARGIGEDELCDAEAPASVSMTGRITAASPFS